MPCRAKLLVPASVAAVPLICDADGFVINVADPADTATIARHGPPLVDGFFVVLVVTVVAVDVPAAAAAASNDIFPAVVARGFAVSSGSVMAFSGPVASVVLDPSVGAGFEALSTGFPFAVPFATADMSNDYSGFDA
jgi:hypothetical protein